MDPTPTGSPIDQLRNLQQTIIDKLEHLGNLNVQYRNKQEKQFIKIFLHVMDKMSSELSSANQQYQNIDREIEKDEKCVELSTKLMFFKNQSFFLKQELECTEELIRQEKNMQKEIIKEKKLLQGDLFQKSKQIFRYRAKARSLERNQTNITQTNEICSKQKPKLQQKFFKRHSFSQTKNTNLSYFTNKIEPTSQTQSPKNKTSSQADFKVKAAKIARQKKYLHSKTYYQNAFARKNKNKPQTLAILR